MITILFVIILTLIIIELRYKPRFDTIRGKKIIWYNSNRYDNSRDFIFLKNKHNE